MAGFRFNTRVVFFRGRDERFAVDNRTSVSAAAPVAACTTSSEETNMEQQTGSRTTVVAEIHVENEETILVTNASDDDGANC